MKKLLMPIFSLLFLAGCGTAEESRPGDATNQAVEPDEPLEIFTTVYPLSYFAERIGGKHVDVQSIYPPGSNAHTFEPTQQDMIALAEADALFYIGLEMEGFIDNAKESLKGEKVELVAASGGISESELIEGHSHDHEEHAHAEETEEHSHEHGEEGHHHEHGDEAEAHEHGMVDPHVWLSPQLSQKLAESIKAELVERDQANAAEFEANYEKLKKDLADLDQSFQTMADESDTKSFFISHESFGYIADAYGLEQVAVAGLNSEDEPSQKELTEIVELAKEKNIRFIAFEQNVSSKIAEVIRQEIGAEAVQLHNLSVLTQEDLDDSQDYFTLMETNLAVLEKILN